MPLPIRPRVFSPPIAQPRSTPRLVPARAPLDTFVRPTGRSIVARVRGPEDAALPGDIVRSPLIPFAPEQVLSTYDQLLRREQQVPGTLAAIEAQPFPAVPADQLTWALARARYMPSWPAKDWNVATNDGRSELVAYVRGLAWGRSVGLPADSALEADAEAALAFVGGLDYRRIEAIAAGPMPQDRQGMLQWGAAHALATWNAFNTTQTFEERAVYLFVAGVRAKAFARDRSTAIVSERRTIDVDGDTRVYAIHTPPGPMPVGGWPTILMFHGSYGGNAPEQEHSYQQLNAIADARGYRVIYPVGLPQDRADTTTGQGMLNWDPVGAGAGEANDNFVVKLIDELTKDGVLDPKRVVAAGHSQGGFYVSGLVASHPDLFRAAAIFGAGAGSVAGNTDFSQLGRRTPLLLRVGENDIHVQMADALAAKLGKEGYGALTYDRPTGRGHEVLDVDYERFFSFVDQTPVP